MDAPELIVIRHGRSEWNERGLWQGHADPPLSAAGQAQAHELVAELSEWPIDRIESSDLLRARETAAPVAQALQLPVRTDPLYRELDIGAWSGLTREQIELRNEPGFSRFLEGRPDAVPPGGEARWQLWERAHRAVQSLCERCPGERVAIFTHGGFVHACFETPAVRNGSVHRGRADAVLERLARGPVP